MNKAATPLTGGNMYMRQNGGETQSGRCFLCERGFEAGELGSFNGFSYEPDFPSPLFGPKCVCDNCSRALAETIGYVSRHDFDQAVTDLDLEVVFLTAERDKLQKQVDEGVAGVLKLVKAAQRSTPARKAPVREA